MRFGTAIGGAKRKGIDMSEANSGCSMGRETSDTVEEPVAAPEIEVAYEIESADDHVSEARHQLWSVDGEKLDEGGRAELDEVLGALETAAEALSGLLRRVGEPYWEEE